MQVKIRYRQRRLGRKFIVRQSRRSIGNRYRFFCRIAQSSDRPLRCQSIRSGFWRGRRDTLLVAVHESCYGPMWTSLGIDGAGARTQSECAADVSMHQSIASLRRMAGRCAIVASGLKTTAARDVALTWTDCADDRAYLMAAWRRHELGRGLVRQAREHLRESRMLAS